MHTLYKQSDMKEGKNSQFSLARRMFTIEQSGGGWRAFTHAAQTDVLMGTDREGLEAWGMLHSHRVKLLVALWLQQQRRGEKRRQERPQSTTRAHRFHVIARDGS